MTYQYRPSGLVCSRMIEIEIREDGRIGRVAFTGGCPGNLSGISRLVVGMRLKDIVERLKGIRCGSKPTSCPDQLARALEMIEKGELGDNLKELND